EISGSNRYLVDYLADEVLERLPGHLRAFVLRTSILDRMCGELCDAILGLEPSEHTNVSTSKPAPVRTDYSQVALEELERRNLFVVPLDGERRWYRYHHLFAEVLRTALQTGAPALITTLHLRAAAWFEQAGLIDEAIPHLLAADAGDQAGALVERQAAPMIERGDLVPLQRWFDQLPGSIVRGRPALGLAGAMLAIARGELDIAAARLYAADTAPDSDPRLRL